MTGKLADAAQLAGLAVSRPMEFLDRVRGRRERGRELPPPELDAEIVNPVEVAHRLAGFQEQDGCAEAVAQVRGDVFGRLGSDPHHHDGGTALAEMLWVLVRHTRPQVLVETGVARGVSSAFMLNALDANGAGHLWSIDLPPTGTDWRDQTGIAVAREHRDRWTYLRGASRRRLPRLVRERPIDVFVHDGLHTAQNMLTEFRTVWPRLRPGGFLVSDDADDNHAVLTFAQEIGCEPTLVRETEKDDVLAVFRR